MRYQDLFSTNEIRTITIHTKQSNPDISRCFFNNGTPSNHHTYRMAKSWNILIFFNDRTPSHHHTCTIVMLNKQGARCVWSWWQFLIFNPPWENYTHLAQTLRDKVCTMPRMYSGICGGSVYISRKNAKITPGVQVGPLEKGWVWTCHHSYSWPLFRSSSSLVPYQH